MNEHREVRVTPRKSVQTPFVAPDLSPVSTSALELEKGLIGWTDHDYVIPSSNPFKAHDDALAKNLLEEITVGTVTRKREVSTVSVRRSRPTKRRW